MMKHLRKLLSALLVLTMLLSALPMAAFAEEGKAPAVVTEVIDTHTHEQTEEPAIEPTIELIETPAIEEAEEPAAEPIEAPAVEEADESAAEPTEAPAVEEVEELASESIETPTVEETEEPATELIETPAVEETEEPVVEPTEAFDNSVVDDGDSYQKLTAEQLIALETLPEGFSSEIVTLAMMRSSGCGHTKIEMGIDYGEFVYTPLNDEKHMKTISILGRYIYCRDCYEMLQRIKANDIESYEEYHHYTDNGNAGVDNNTSIECPECGASRTIDLPCHHTKFNVLGRKLYCQICSACVDLYEHTHTIPYIWFGTEHVQYDYDHWDADQHYKTIHSFICEDETKSVGSCIVCGVTFVRELHGDTDYPLEDFVDQTDYQIQYTYTGVLEKHSFVDGACKYCGEKQTEEICQHKKTKRVENTSKRTTERKPFDDTQHEVIVTKYYELYCADCNAYIRDDGTEESTSKEAHDFGNGDTCECGYAKEECVHDEKEKLDIATNVAYERIDGDRESHKIVRTRCYGMFCKACGELVSSLDPVVTNGKQKHTWKSTVYNNGVEKCSYCGAAKYENPTKGGYYAALKNLKEGESPLEEGSIVRSIILSELQKNGYSREYAEEVITRAASAPETYRDIFVYSFLEYDRNSSKMKGNKFVPLENMMYSEKDGPVETFFHESGHAADGQPFREGNRECYYYSLYEEYLEVLWNSMREDLKNFIEHTAFESPYKFDDSISKQAIQHVIDGIISYETGETTGIGRWIIKTRPASDFTEEERTIYAKLIEDISERFAEAPFSNAMMVQDVMRGLTQNSLHSDWGHETSYWENAARANLEAWAEWFSSKMCGVDEYVEYNQTYFPKATRVLDDIACDMVEHYRKMIRES